MPKVLILTTSSDDFKSSYVTACPVMAIFIHFCYSTFLFSDRSGSVRAPFGIRSGTVRNPFGVRSESVRNLLEICWESVRVLFGSFQDGDRFEIDLG